MPTVPPLPSPPASAMLTTPIIVSGPLPPRRPRHPYDSPRHPGYPPGGIYPHARWTLRKKGRKTSSWYRDPKLAAYWVYEDLRTRPRRFVWDPDPCLTFGGKKYPVEPMPRKVVWRATGTKNYHDLGRGGRIPLPEKTATWSGPARLGPHAAELRRPPFATVSGHARGFRHEGTASAEGSRPSSRATWSSSNSLATHTRQTDGAPRCTKERGRRSRPAEKTRRPRDAREKAAQERLERKNAEAWQKIHNKEKKAAAGANKKKACPWAEGLSRKAKAVMKTNRGEPGNAREKPRQTGKVRDEAKRSQEALDRSAWRTSISSVASLFPKLYRRHT